MPYLIFNSKAEAMERNDQAGVDKGLAYHINNENGVTRYVWAIAEEGGGSNRASLILKEEDVTSGLLTPTETSALVDDLPVDWQHPEDP